jgi:hypothetical protein
VKKYRGIVVITFKLFESLALDFPGSGAFWLWVFPVLGFEASCVRFRTQLVFVSLWRKGLIARLMRMFLRQMMEQSGIYMSEAGQDENPVPG